MASRTSRSRHLAARRSAADELFFLGFCGFVLVVVGAMLPLVGNLAHSHAVLGSASSVLALPLYCLGVVFLVAAVLAFLLIEPTQAFACSMTPGRQRMMVRLLQPLEFLRLICVLEFLRRAPIPPSRIRGFAASFVGLRRSLDTYLRFSFA